MELDFNYSDSRMLIQVSPINNFFQSMLIIGNFFLNLYVILVTNNVTSIFIFFVEENSNLKILNIMLHFGIEPR